MVMFGFALKDALSNTLAGVLILIYQPFRRGDCIIISGFDGTVDQIDLRYTTLSSEGDRILIPNSTMFTNPIKVVGGSKS
jgi:small conductance mechanosensitive channel